MIKKYNIIGVNHKCSDKEYRESILPDQKSVFDSLNYFFKINEIEYCLILSTSNRLEYHFLTESNSIYKILQSYFLNFKIPDFDKFFSIAYSYTGKIAIEHLFKVISSIDSEKLGDCQIISQVKNAFHNSENIKNNSFMHRLLNAAIRTSLTVRANTAIGEPIKSIAGVACSHIIDICSQNDKILFIGYDNNIKTIAIKLNEKDYTNLAIFVDSEIEIPSVLKPFIINNVKNNIFDTIAIVSNKELDWDNSKNNVKLIIDFNNYIKIKNDYVKYVTQSTILEELEVKKQEKLASLNYALCIVNNELLRFESQCNETDISS